MSTLQATGSTPVLELDGVHFAYDGRPVLEDVSLRVFPGELVGLIGPNGSGKTTLLRLALGLLRPQAGTVRLFGQPTAQFRDWGRVAYVPQRATLQSGVPATVREVVHTGRLHGPRLWRPWSAADEAAVARALREVDLENLADEPVARLSGGQAQRVLLARALAGDPALLLLDEPTVGIDPGAQERFLVLLRRLREERGVAMVLVSHDVGAISQEVTRLACLNRRLFYCGPPQDFTPGWWSDLYGHPVHLVEHRHAHDHHAYDGEEGR
ncbi:metal ABC transporter ATP-binding protein [Thermaerobacter sp. PB12/4term]|uniref:metal ABC transporter ATP-binding protein n=1 Tax=Thermaerobacter sp. PB12/4term TaxID=2293838 RepID=UPI000E328F4C|nr:metal ABC transporter ATP-binding protein [Thermaerobacter sp. PB12/4term]QIA27708.1 metal ABC transporter ATP-binding protein [Thermaerobacter sp. PB12/4term]